MNNRRGNQEGGGGDDEEVRVGSFHIKMSLQRPRPPKQRHQCEQHRACDQSFTEGLEQNYPGSDVVKAGLISIT